MRKILISLMTFVLVVGMVGAGAFAYFSDVETSTGNVFTAGTIDLSAPEPVPIKMEDLKPCEVGYWGFFIYNDGTNEMDVWKHLTNVECYENEIIEPERDWYDTWNGGVAKNDIDTVILYDLYVTSEEPETDPPDPYLDPEGFALWLNEWFECVIDEGDGLHIDDVECNYIYLGTLEFDECMLIIQSYHMEGDTENWAQSDVMTFDVEFFAQQTTGGAPSPVPELEGFEKP